MTTSRSVALMAAAYVQLNKQSWPGGASAKPPLVEWGEYPVDRGEFVALEARAADGSAATIRQASVAHRREDLELVVHIITGKHKTITAASSRLEELKDVTERAFYDDLTRTNVDIGVPDVAKDLEIDRVARSTARLYEVAKGNWFGDAEIALRFAFHL